MSFNVNKYRTKNGTCWQILKLCYKLYKRRNRRKLQEFDNKIEEQQVQKNKILNEENNIHYFYGGVLAVIFFILICVFNMFFPQWWDKNADFVLGIGVAILECILWLIGIIIAGILVRMLYHALIFILSTFISAILDEIDKKRQIKIESVLSKALNNALEDIELYKERAIEELKKRD